MALNTKAWAALHPQAQLRACIDQACTVLDESNEQLSDGLFTDNGTQVHTLTITATEGGRSLLSVTSRFHLEASTLHSACGDRTSYRTTITLNSSGHLVVPVGAAAA